MSTGDDDTWGVGQRPPVLPVQADSTSNGNDVDWYPIGVAITGLIVFVGSWIYCIATYGFLFGVGLGWLPSFIVAVVAGFLWPLIALVVGLAIAVIVFFFLRQQ